MKQKIKNASEENPKNNPVAGNPEASINDILQTLKQRDAELAVINSVQQALLADIGMQGIYDLVGDKIRELFDSQFAAVATFNFENNTEEFQYLYENGQRFNMAPRPIDKVRQLIIDTKELLCINENADKVWSEITGEEPTVIPGTKLTKSAIYVPMTVSNEIRGYVSLQNLDHENAFSDTDARLLSTLVNSMSAAIENARLFNETEQRNAELAVINSVQEGLVAEMDMQGIYDLVGDKIRELFDAQVAAVATFNYENNTEEFQYIYEDGQRFNLPPRIIDKVRQQLIDTKELLCINENADEIWLAITGEEPTVVPGTKLTKSAIYVPMIVGTEVRGYVSLQNLDREHAFSESNIRLLSTLVNSMSVAIENARLFNETEQRNAELAVINSVQEGLVAEMDMQGIYDLVGDKIRDLFDAQVAGIYSFDHQSGTEHFHYLYEDGERLYPESRPLNEIRIWLIKNAKLLLIGEDVDNAVYKITGQVGEAVPGTRNPKSMLFVPLMVGAEVRGCVSLQNLDREHAFSDSDVRLLSTLANSMSVAIENARLFKETTRLLAETEQRNAELAVINSVQEGLVREMDMEAIYSLVGDRVCEVLNTQTMVIRTFDISTGLETWEYAVENSERLYSELRPIIWANHHLLKTKAPLLINEKYVETAKKYGDKYQGISKGLAPKSAIFVPMLVGGEVVGSVSLQNVKEENAFTESDVRLLSTLTNSMSVALENARLFNETARLLAETEQRATEMQTVNNISRALVSQLEFDALMDLVGKQMRDTFKADIVYLAIHDRESNMLHFPYYFGDSPTTRPFGNGITEKIILSKEPLLVNQDLESTYHKIKADIKGKMVQSYLGVPIISGNQSIGVVSVQSTEKENRFNENDLRLLTTIAANLGVAMQNAEAYQKLQAALTDLKSTQQQLVQSEKMASLGELTAGIAHEIQNPLNFVNNFSDLNKELIDEQLEEIANGDLEEVKALALNIKENEAKITHHGKRAEEIIKSMLQHSRTGSVEKELTDINMIADEYLRLAYHGLRAKDKSFNATFKSLLDPKLPKISAIPQDIGRVLLNLLNNAFQAVKKVKDPEVIVSTEWIGKHIQIMVKDNGPGIPENIKEKIFQPFFTTKPTGEGTGLGLSMSYDIVTKGHNGTIVAESEENIGTTFIISLPIRPS